MTDTSTGTPSDIAIHLREQIEQTVVGVRTTDVNSPALKDSINRTITAVFNDRLGYTLTPEQWTLSTSVDGFEVTMDIQFHPEGFTPREWETLGGFINAIEATS